MDPNLRRRRFTTHVTKGRSLRDLFFHFIFGDMWLELFLKRKGDGKPTRLGERRNWKNIFFYFGDISRSGKFDLEKFFPFKRALKRIFFFGKFPIEESMSLIRF